MKDALKDDLSDLVKRIVTAELSSFQMPDFKKLDDLELQIKRTAEVVSEVKKNSTKMLTELHHYRILYDEFSERVKKDLSNNVIAFDNFVSQVRKIGDSVTSSFKTLDSKTDKASQAVSSLHGEIKLFLTTKFPDYVRSGAHIIDLDVSVDQPSSPKPSHTSSTFRATRSVLWLFFCFKDFE